MLMIIPHVAVERKSANLQVTDCGGDNGYGDGLAGIRYILLTTTISTISIVLQTMIKEIIVNFLGIYLDRLVWYYSYIWFSCSWFYVEIPQGVDGEC